MATTACLFLAVVPATAACKVKAIFVQPPDNVPEKAVLVVGKKFLDILLPRRNFSLEVQLPAGELLVGVLPTAPVTPEMPLGAPHFKIPETWTDCILLFFHDPANKVFPAKIIPVNTSSANFPMGDTVIFNVSSATVVGKFGEITAQVKPGQSVTVKPPRSGSGAYPVAIDCTIPGESRTIALCRSTWQHEANARQIMFVTPMPGQKKPSMWSVLDRPLPVEKPKEN